MKIVSLRAENIKRLSVVEIRPDGGLVEITGKNAQGKSSLLDSIFYALAGKKALPSSPIRRGADAATIHLDLGELEVRRWFTAQDDGSYTTGVVVQAKNGGRFSDGQSVLNAILGEYTFDPLEFATRLKPADQVEVLKRFVSGFDFAADERAYKADYDKRTEANRKAKELRGEANAILLPLDAPTEPVNEADILAALRGAGETNRALEQQHQLRQREVAAVQELETRAGGLFDEAAALRKRARELDAEATRLADEVLTRTAAIRALAPLDAPVDTADLAEQLQKAQASNALYARAQRRREVVEAAQAKEAESAALTEALDAREKARALAVAKAAMPVPGLGFDKGEVTLYGLPFNQASGAEQLRASVAIAAALNPKLRIAFIRDASRLDTDSMRALAEYAEAHGVQIWAETVEQGRPTAIVIEDGAVRADPLSMAAE